MTEPSETPTWTWHPGAPLAPLVKGCAPTVATAVKLHRGE